MIKRYDPDWEDIGKTFPFAKEMKNVSDGDYVLYEDCKEIILELQNALIFSKGSALMACEELTFGGDWVTAQHRLREGLKKTDAALLNKPPKPLTGAHRPCP